MIMHALFYDSFRVVDFLHLNGQFPEVHPDQDNHVTIVLTMIIFLIVKINNLGRQIKFMYFHYYFTNMDTRADDTFIIDTKER